MKVLVTGASGQFGIECQRASPPGWTVIAVARQALDIGDAAAVQAMVKREAPDLIINAAAYTAVDRAESEPETAYRINRDGPGHLAASAVKAGSRLVHISTDFVFDGERGRAYAPNSPTSPLGVYGASKLAGEAAVLAAGGKALIVRTAWVYSPHGNNFLKTMLRLMSSRDEVRVVADQIGAPTSTGTLAGTVWGLVDVGAEGIFHATDAGVASWYDFAQAILEEATDLGLLTNLVRVTPITTADYPTPARRPAFSVLDNSATWRRLGRPASHWRMALRAVLVQMSERGGPTMSGEGAQ